MAGGEIWQLVDSRGIGGIERHVAILTQALNDAGRPARAVLLADHGDHDFLRQLRAAAVPFTVLPGGFRPLRAALADGLPALLHTHGYKAGILGRFAARLAGIPCLSTFHAGEKGRFPVSLYQVLDAATARLGPRIAVSEPIAQTLPQPVSVIGNFVPVPDQAPPPPPSRVIAFVGRLSAEKGPDLFCALAERFAGRLSFEMFGDGPMRPGLEAAHGGRVRFHGMVSDPAAIWPRIGLLLMPSRAEGLPMAAIEAMAAGVPVAASRLGALPELIDDGANGYLFAPGDLAAAAAVLERWTGADAAARAALSHRAWEKVQAAYGPHARLPQILALYDAALAGRDGRV
ncbi:glycosyltransferase family 4 protein [Xanthobacter sp. VTT E-85241]|uniref:glycosyltransferase family 4 protein n=1 Tax=Roseixanthobacter finlandensis TaxID=3119922 RepID=UPI0037294984